MYSSTIKINNEKLKGTLDFWVIRKVQEDLQELGYEFRIHELFKSISDINDINMHVVMSILLFSIYRYSNIDIEDIEDKFMEDVFDIDKFNKLFEYLNKLFSKCMPQNSSNDEKLFEEYEDIKEKEDWDFPYMEYLWYSVLKRSDDFYSITPKVFFSQMNIYKGINNIKDDDVDYL